MAAISQLTQSRLSLLLLDKETGALLNKIPTYAEASLTVEMPSYTIHQQLEFSEGETPIRRWFATHGFVLDAINGVLTANVAESDFDAIGDKHKLYIAILDKIKETLDDNETRAHQQQLIVKIVLQ